ncbi:MAG: hypothetical protein IIA88_04235 [Bacteroidetes bacterium]|nr:hypothetical protein [Bacteroidota bacterium]
MNIDIYKGIVSISVYQLGSYFVIPGGKGNLKSLVTQLLNSTKPKAKNVQISISIFQKYVDKYSEQAASDPNADLAKYYSQKPKIQKASITAISAYGEALAGWYMETYERMTMYSRPKGLKVDIIFTDKNKKSDAYYVQAKATTEGDFRTPMKKGAEDILNHIQGVKLMYPFKNLSTYIIGTKIKSQSDCELVIIQINII